MTAKVAGAPSTPAKKKKAAAAAKIKAPANITSPLDFAKAFLAQYFPNVTPAQAANDEAFLVAWQQAEGNPGWGYHNPFNTTQKEAGSGSGVVGITNFPDWATGLKGTYDALMSGHGAWYASIRGDLAAGANPQQTAADLAATPWASGHYGATAAAPGGSVGRILGSAGFNPAGVHPQNPTGSTASSSSASATLTDFPGGSLDPLNWASDAASSAAKPIIEWIDSFAIRAALVVFGGLALLVGLALLFHEEEEGHDAAQQGDDDAETERVADREEPESAPAEEGAPAASSTTKSAPPKSSSTPIGKAKPSGKDDSKGTVSKASSDVAETSEDAAEVAAG